MHQSYFTAPAVSPRTNWRCATQPAITTGNAVIVAAADIFAQNKPSDILKEAINTHKCLAPAL